MANHESKVAESRFYEMLGIRVNKLTIADLNAAEGECIRGEKPGLIVNHNVHSIYLFHRDEKMRALYDHANFVHVDGMALIHIGMLLGLPLRPQHRVTWLDWLYPLLGEAQRRGWRVFYLGSRGGVAEKAASKLRREFESLEIETACGYFDARVGSAENQQIVARINAYKPDILMVGMGMPRQEHWIIDNIDQLEVGVVHAPGACFEYVAGIVPTPPRWIGRVGMEWFYRFASEPTRLWRRYLVEPWFVMGLIVREMAAKYLGAPAPAYERSWSRRNRGT